jgi:hypothetical protein
VSDGLRQRVRATIAGTAASLVMSSALAAGAGAVEPLDDHSGGAGTYGSGAIDHAGDRDWYAVTLGSETTHATVFVERTGGSCAPDALRMTVLNPEGRPIRWAVVAPGHTAGLDLPSFKPGRYFVEVDAAGRPDCADVTYKVVRAQGSEQQNAAGAICAAARQDYAERVKARDIDRRYASSNARSRANLRRWPKTLRKYLARAKAACARRR